MSARVTRQPLAQMRGDVLKVGQIGEVVEPRTGLPTVGEILLRIAGGYVSLTNLGNTYPQAPGQTNAPTVVRLSTNDTVTITVE